MSLDLFVQTAPGLEPVVEAELHELGFAPESVEPGGVGLSGKLSVVAALNLHLACASRVLVTAGGFRATALGEWERKAGSIDWTAFLRPGQPIALRVTSRKSRLYHTGAVAERLVRAAAAVVPGVHLASTSWPAESESFDADDPANVARPLPPQRFVVRGIRDRWTIRADTSGEHLHRRGYRLQTGRAPLRESLAAGVLRLAEWDPDRPLVDPLCGSGTFVIEAALRACRRAPGDNRGFAFQQWPDYDPDEWTTLRAEALRRMRPAPAPLLGSDRDAGVVEAARANAERAGIAGSVSFTKQAVSNATAPAGQAPGLLACNPPWGQRVGESRTLRDLYARLGQVARREFRGWRMVLLSPDASLVAQFDRRARSIAQIPAGGLSVGVWTVDLL